MIIPVLAALGVLVPILLGGRVSRLAGVRLRYPLAVALALLVQIVIIEVVTDPEWVLKAAHIATYLVAAGFLYVNRRIPGLWLVGLGAASNGVTIALNGGTLPARLGALQAAGLDDESTRFVNSGVMDHPRLAFLGDVFAIPAQLPLANVFSVGDVLIILGVCVAAWRICGTRWTPAWDAGAAARRALRRVPRHQAAGHPGGRFDGRPHGGLGGRLGGAALGHGAVKITS